MDNSPKLSRSSDGMSPIAGEPVAFFQKKKNKDCGTQISIIEKMSSEQQDGLPSYLKPNEINFEDKLFIDKEGIGMALAGEQTAFLDSSDIGRLKELSTGYTPFVGIERKKEDFTVIYNIDTAKFNYAKNKDSILPIVPENEVLLFEGGSGVKFNLADATQLRSVVDCGNGGLFKTDSGYTSLTYLAKDGLNTSKGILGPEGLGVLHIFANENLYKDGIGFYRDNKPYNAVCADGIYASGINVASAHSWNRGENDKVYNKPVAVKHGGVVTKHNGTRSILVGNIRTEGAEPICNIFVKFKDTTGILGYSIIQDLPEKIGEHWIIGYKLVVEHENAPNLEHSAFYEVRGYF